MPPKEAKWVYSRKVEAAQPHPHAAGARYMKASGPLQHVGTANLPSIITKAPVLAWAVKMSQFSMRQSPRWNPRSILQVWPEEYPSCTGITQRGTRCRNTISQADLGEAAEILDNLAVRRPKKGIPNEKLADLAYVLLCKRWHRQPGHSQISSVTRTWKSKIDTFYSRCEQVDVRRLGTQTTTFTRLSPSDVRSQRVPIHAPALSSVSPPQATARPTTRSGRHSEHDTPTASGLTRRTVFLNEDQDSSGSSDVSSDEDLSAASSDDTDASPNASLLEEEEPELTALQPLRSTTNPSTAPDNDVAETEGSRPTRKPLTEPCCVCMETLDSDTDAVWCRAQCGQNIHRGCFNEWRNQCYQTYDNYPDRRNTVLDIHVHELPRLRSVTCVFCRTSWKWEWED